MQVKDLIELLKSVKDTDMEVCFADADGTVYDIRQVELAVLTKESGVGVLLTTYK